VTDETLDVAQDPIVYHVDFSEEELARVIRFVLKFFPQYHSLTIDGLAEICKYFPLQGVLDKELPDRSAEDIKNFVSDLLEKRIVPTRPARVLSLERGDGSDLARVRRDNKVSSLLLARETEGNRGFGRTRSLANFQNEFQIAREDELSVIAEFTNCAGDIATISWVSTGNLICGTTVHSDSHNQQYNKPGNLLLYSSTSATLRAFPDHRVPRPLVEKGDNSTDAMRQSQDPWLYSSVVSSDYDPISNRAFTSSFDHTVKVWEVDEEGRAMKLLATWKHEGNVNFIAAAKDGSGRVASAADVPSEAVRIYTVNPYDIENSPFQAFSCSRNDAGDIKKWAYYPSCLQWGKAAYTQQLLAVGYSPRSLSGDDTDIPEDKFNTGEITVWDAEACRRIPVTTATTANVFEVTWHPTLQLFLAATSPCGLSIEHGTRTQIHIFQRDRDREEVAYCEYQSLDCKAADINGLTFMPNSLRHAYVTAACTDGKVYVWDTAWGNDPIHILRHGESLEGFHEQVETLDTGVMFMAWCKTADRLYTGSSDGVVKVWNIRSRKKPFVRNLLEAPGPISFGAFSPDHSTLAIGDATGRLYLLSHDKRDELEAHYTTLPGLSRRVRQPTPFIPHAEPPPPRDPEHLQDESLGGSIATYARRKYLESQQLVQTSNPVLGVVQGPNYASTMHYRREAHEDNDPEKPLLLSYERQQQSSQHWGGVCVQDSLMRLKDTQTSNEVSAMHERNTMKDLDIGKIASTDLATLLQEKAILSVDDWDYTYEELPAELH
jgi:WD40 repeat protein